MLRNELQTALHDVVLACLEAADGHAAAASILADDPLAATLRAWAEARRAAAARLGDRVRELGDLPPEPDADLETLRELATRVKAALSPDQRQTVLAERAAAEAHLLTTLEHALAQPELSAETRALLQQIQSDARATHHRLAAATPTEE